MKSRQEKMAFFAGLSAFIGVFENFIPLPVPFLRLGLANIPVCFSFTLFNFRECLMIVFFKVVMTQIFKGTLFSYPALVAFSGNLLFLIVGFPFYKIFKRHISFVSLSIVGAFSHNCGQVIAASFFIPKKPLFYFSMILLVLGLILGFINGILCNIINRKVFIRMYHG